MKRINYGFVSLVIVISFFVATPAYADVVWPALRDRTIAGCLVALGLIIEFPFIWWMTRFSLAKCLLVDIVMNLASTLLGIVLILLAGILGEVFPGLLLYQVFNIGTFNPGTLVEFVLAVVINAFIEKFVIKKIFSLDIGRKGFRLLCLANAISVGIVYLSFYIV